MQHRWHEHQQQLAALILFYYNVEQLIQWHGNHTRVPIVHDTSMNVMWSAYIYIRVYVKKMFYAQQFNVVRLETVDIRQLGIYNVELYVCM